VSQGRRKPDRIGCGTARRAGNSHKALGRQSFDKHLPSLGRRKRNRIRWQRTPIQSLAHIPSYHRDNLGPDQYEWALKPHHGAQVLPMIAISNMAASISIWCARAVTEQPDDSSCHGASLRLGAPQRVRPGGTHGAVGPPTGRRAGRRPAKSWRRWCRNGGRAADIHASVFSVELFQCLPSHPIKTTDNTISITSRRLCSLHGLRSDHAVCPRVTGTVHTRARKSELPK